MSKIWDRTLTTLLTLAALAVAAALVRREFFATQAAAPPRAEYVREWRDILPATRLVTGDPQAPVTIVEFSDFGCPACRLFHCALQVVRTKAPGTGKPAFLGPESVHDVVARRLSFAKPGGPDPKRQSSGRPRQKGAIRGADALSRRARGCRRSPRSRSIARLEVADRGREHARDSASGYRARPRHHTAAPPRSRGPRFA